MLRLPYFFITLFAFLLPTQILAEELPSVDRILIKKSERKMLLFDQDKVVRKYTIRLGRNPIGDKVREGDNRTPEGDYTIVSHNPHSSYHLSMRISYPTDKQRAQAEKNGYSAGGNIMIHGYPNKSLAFFFKFIHRWRDWTAGCIAVTNTEIEEIYKLVKDGTPIRIEP